MTRDVLVVGCGYAGLETSRRLLRRLPPDVRLTVVNPQPYMTYQPLLPETAAGSVEPGHVVVPLRRALPGARVVTAALTGLDTDTKLAVVTADRGGHQELRYDVLVLATGAVTRTMPVPGLLDHAVGFRTVEEALYLRNQVLSCLETAAMCADEEGRRRALTFVVVGAGYAGVEALAEVQDMVRRVCRDRTDVAAGETRWLLVEAADRILGQLPDRLANYVLERLVARGVEVRTGTCLVECGPGFVRLSDASTVSTDTVVWAAGVSGSPVLRGLGLPVDGQGRVETDPQLRVPWLDDVWAVGDCAAVPDITSGGTCPPTAQHAVRQAARLASNLRATLRGRPPRAYRHRDAGAVASLGLRQGVAELYGVPVRGYPAWLLHRIYHGSRLPSRDRRWQVLTGWLLDSVFGRHPVPMHQPRTPQDALRAAAQTTTPTAAVGGS